MRYGRFAVRCSDCGHEDEVRGPICVPTPEIVRKVCERDPCPSCGQMTMRPTPEIEPA